MRSRGPNIKQLMDKRWPWLKERLPALWHSRSRSSMSRFIGSWLILIRMASVVLFSQCPGTVFTTLALVYWIMHVCTINLKCMRHYKLLCCLPAKIRSFLQNWSTLCCHFLGRFCIENGHAPLALLLSRHRTLFADITFIRCKDHCRALFKRCI